MRAALDTNVLVYAEGYGDRPRVERSRALLQTLAKADVVIPLQCLGELSVAADAGALLLISEDFNPGFTWRGVRVVNPYTEPLDPLLVQITESAQLI